VQEARYAFHTIATAGLSGADPEGQPGDRSEVMGGGRKATRLRPARPQGGDGP